MKRFFIVFLAAFPTCLAYSYPIIPQTLRKLIIESEYIVFAKIENPDPPGIPETYFDKVKQDSVTYYIHGLWGDGLADLHIQQVLKGNIDTQKILVKYENQISNPRPPMYPDSSLVIAFLTKSDTSNYYTTVGLSYGTKIIKNESVFLSYKTNIINFVEILKEKNKQKQKIATTEWLVQCALDTNIRWDGAYELSRKRHWISYYDYSKEASFSKYLNKGQKQKIENIVLTTDTIGYNELCLSDFVSKKQYPILREKILKNLEFAYFLIAKDLMKKYIDITPNSKLKAIYEKYENLNSLNDDDEENRKMVIQEFIHTARE